MRCAAESFVHAIVAPPRSAMRSASRLTETGKREPGAGLRRRRGSRARGAPVRRSSACRVVDDRRGLAVGVEHEPEVGTRRTHEVAHRLEPRLAVLARPAVPTRSLAYGLTASTVAPILASTFGITSDTAPKRVVEHDLEPAALQPVGVDAALERGRVVLDGAGREHDVADVARERAAEVLAVRAAARSCAGCLRRCRRPSRRRSGSRRCRGRSVRAAR